LTLPCGWLARWLLAMAAGGRGLWPQTRGCPLAGAGCRRVWGRRPVRWPGPRRL